MIICFDTYFIGHDWIEPNIPGLFACDLVWNSVTEITDMQQSGFYVCILHEMVRSLWLYEAVLGFNCTKNIVLPFNRGNLIAKRLSVWKLSLGTVNWGEWTYRGR